MPADQMTGPAADPGEASTVAALSSLSQPTRLRMMRSLIAAGPAGLHIGAIARAAQLSRGSAAFHMTNLVAAGLAAAVPGQEDSFAAQVDTVTGLTHYLMADCCAGQAATDPVACALLAVAPIDRGAAALVDALRAADLPSEDLTHSEGQFFAARCDGQVVGYGGLELYGRHALLRSVVILPEARRRGLGRLLVEDLSGHAADRGVERVFLLTQSAASFFRRLGFAEIARADAPRAIRESQQATTTCTSATVMARATEPVPALRVAAHSSTP